MAKYIVVDLDHTLSDAAWRDDLCPSTNPVSSWAHYFEGQEHDKLIEATALIVNAMSLTHIIVAVTGRPEQYRAVTEKWIAKHKLPIKELIMRHSEDHRPSGIVKYNLIQERFLDMDQIEFLIEDRSDCVQALLPLCRPIFQLWDVS